MSELKISENLKRFIFAHVDSAELLDVLLLMNSDRSQSWDSEKIGQELRSSSNSVASRLMKLKQLGLVVETNSQYICKPQTDELDLIVKELDECNKLMRHRVLQLIFSPLKQGRLIAEGFLVNSKDSDKDGEDND